MTAVPAWILRREDLVRDMIRTVVLGQIGAGEGDVAMAQNSVQFEPDDQTSRDGTMRIAFLQRGTTTLLCDRELNPFRYLPATEPAA